MQIMINVLLGFFILFNQSQISLIFLLLFTMYVSSGLFIAIHYSEDKISFLLRYKMHLERQDGETQHIGLKIFYCLIYMLGQ